MDLRSGDLPQRRDHELGDALAWLVSVANLAGVDAQRAFERCAKGCPKCRASPCSCKFVP